MSNLVLVWITGNVGKLTWLWFMYITVNHCKHKTFSTNNINLQTRSYVKYPLFKSYFIFLFDLLEKIPDSTFIWKSFKCKNIQVFCCHQFSIKPVSKKEEISWCRSENESKVVVYIKIKFGSFTSFRKQRLRLML